MSQLSFPPVLEEVLASARELPPFPEVMRKVMPLIQQMAPVSEIEAVIKYDQALTARVLALSRSVHYARRQPIRSLRDAIFSLGQKQLIQVVLTACTSRYFKGKWNGYDLREGEVWEHAVAVAIMAEMIAHRIELDSFLTVYTAALLHDIGKSVLHMYVSNYFDSILPLVRDGSMRFIDAERQVLGIDHQQLGSIIARQWRFPPEVVTAIGYHHFPRQVKENRATTAVVYVANRIVSSMGIGCGVDGLWQPNHDEMFLELGLTIRTVEKLMADTVEELDELKSFLSCSA